MENETKKTNKGLITLVIMLVLVIIGLAGYLIYDKLIGKTNEPINNNTNTAQNASTPSTPEDLSEKDYDELIKDAEVTYEDDNYVSYEVNGDIQWANKEYIVYDKKTQSYLNEQKGEKPHITYFGKIDGDYYYFALNSDNSYRFAQNDIYKIDGTLIKTINGVYEEYDDTTKTFIFHSAPVSVSYFRYRWNPTVFETIAPLDDGLAELLIENKIRELSITSWTASDVKVVQKGDNNSYLVSYVENNNDGSKNTLSTIIQYDVDASEWKFDLPGSNGYTSDIYEKYNFKPVN